MPSRRDLRRELQDSLWLETGDFLNQSMDKMLFMLQKMKMIRHHGKIGKTGKTSGIHAPASVMMLFQLISLKRKDTVSSMELHAITGTLKKINAKNGENPLEKTGAIQNTLGAMLTQCATTLSQPFTSMIPLMRICLTGENVTMM